MSEKKIIFDTCKKELGNPGSNLKKFLKKYKEEHKVGVNKESIQYEKLKKTDLFILGAPKEPLNPDQVENLKRLVQTGGNLLIFSHQGGDKKQHNVRLRNGTNLNEVTKEFGIKINKDCVVRTSFYKYLHPKQAYIHNGVLNEEVTRVINNRHKEQKKNNHMFNLGGRDDDEEDYQKEAKRLGCDFVYVNGSTLTVVHPAYPILSSGPMTYPSNRPILAVHQHKSGGKLVVCGSMSMFLDDHFQNEENAKIMEFIMKFFLTNQVQFEFSRQDNEPQKYVHVSDIAEISDNLKSCFQDGEEIPRDFNEMFELQMFKYDFDLTPQVSDAFNKMGVKHEPLTLIVPQFDIPFTGLAPGLFPPVLKELDNPSLELFDLDQEFSDQKVRLAQLANKCQNKDIDYFVREAGDILGVSDKIRNRGEPKAIVKYILEEVINYKKPSYFA